MFGDPLPGIFVVPEESNLRVMHALITGPEGTPYDGGSFIFKLVFPCDYPASPPKVKFLTTGGGVVRFNPNLYANGKVCLSILGTWSGPGWLPVQTLASVLLSIQSLLSAEPMRNEPGYEGAGAEEVRRYNDCIVHETLRVAVLEAVADPGGQPPELRAALLASFAALAPGFADTAAEHQARLPDGTPFRDPLGFNQGCFRFGLLRVRLEEAVARLEAGL